MDKPNGSVPVTAEIVPVSDAAIVLRPVMNITAAKAQLAEFQQFVKEYLVLDEDYGVIPGTKKPTLYKSGAEKLCDVYGLADSYELEKITEDWDRTPELFAYTYKCMLTSRRDGRFLGEGRGSCNSYEEKYKLRDANRKCPLCNQEAIIKGREEYGGGWLCFKKKGGCGAKFTDSDEAITSQKGGKEVNPNIADVQNTVIKMAKKRAKVDAVIAVTRSSGIFTQDVEEAAVADEPGSRTSAQRVADKKIAEFKEKKAKPAQHKPVDCLFYTIPDRFSGHRAVLINLKQFGESINEVAREGLHAILKNYVQELQDGSGNMWVPTVKIPALEKELGERSVPLKKVEATD